MLNQFPSMDFDLLTDLITAFKNYQLHLKPGEKTGMEGFRLWLNEQQYLTGQPDDSGHDEIIGGNEVSVEIGKLLIFINRYAKLIIRKGLTDFPELVSQDFTYLYILMSCASMTKIQLIEKNVHEKPSGLEVIKRLLKHGLIDEKADENDKRSKRVFLTEKGRTTFFSTLDQMSKVSNIITGNLSLAEKKQLNILLKKLEHFHNPLFLKYRNMSINDLEKKAKEGDGTPHNT